MATRLSQHFRDARIAAGLKPGQLASRAGLGTGDTGGSIVSRFEREGEHVLSDRLLLQLASALGIPPDEVELLESEDRRRVRAEWDAWSREPVPPSFLVRMMPSMWHRVALPEGLVARDQILDWVQGAGRWAPYLRCICWSRRNATYIRADGTMYEVDASFNEDGPGPGMSLR